jgi:chromosome segregation ATPase
MAQRVTLDQLAAMVARGFEDVHCELTGVRGELADVRGGLTSVQGELTEIRAVQADHSHRLDRIERKLDSVVERVDDHDVRLRTLEKRRGPRS